MSTRIYIPEDKIAEFCRQNGIQRLSLFGSVPDDLSDILERRVDLNAAQFLSPYFRQEVLEEAEVIYVSS